MVVSGSRKQWDRWHSPSTNWQYIPLIYHLYILPSGGYMLPTTFYGNQKQPLILRLEKNHLEFGGEAAGIGCWQPVGPFGSQAFAVATVAIDGSLWWANEPWFHRISSLSFWLNTFFSYWWRRKKHVLQRISGGCEKIPKMGLHLFFKVLNKNLPPEKTSGPQ